MQVQNIFANSFGIQKSHETKAESGLQGVGFAQSMAQAADRALQTGSKMPGNPVAHMSNPLAPDMWPSRFDARIEYGASKLGMSVEDTKAAFAAIIDRASSEGGFEGPKAFLKSLSAEEREVLQHVQGFADKITDGYIDGMSDEGALNTLLPPGGQRDFNNDGVYGVGKGTFFRFPPDSASQEMKDAWADLTATMSSEELFLAEGRFLSTLISGNVKHDASGTPVGIYHPGEAGYQNPYLADDFSYRDIAENNLQATEDWRGKIGEEQYQRDKLFWSRFVAALDKYGVESA